MKRIVFILIIISLFSSCSNFMQMDFTPEYPALPSGVVNTETAFNWISSNIAYVHGDSEHWQSPNETLAKRSGDCEDFAILLSSFCRSLGHDSRVIVSDEHAVAKIDGTLYDCVPVKTANGYKPDVFKPDTTVYSQPTYDKDIDDVLRDCYYIYGSK